MRNAVLSIVGELLVQELSSESSNDTVKKTRDQYLHLLEVNHFILNLCLYKLL